MKNFLASLALALMLSSAPAIANPSAAPIERISMPPGGIYPNGVALADDGTLYVAQVTQGGVFRRSPQGDWTLLNKGSDMIYAGTSLRLDEARNVLWGASPDFLPQGQPRTPYIFALNATTGAVIKTIAVTDGFANDIAIEPEGSILVTESVGGRLMRLQPGATEFEVLLQDDRLKGDDGIGAAGIARAQNGALAIGNFGSGEMFVFENGQLRQIELPRLIENPDGIGFAPDGSLIVTEGAIESGEGRLLRIENPFDAGERSIEVVVEGLTSPVNVSVTDDGKAYVTESRIRHRLIEGMENQMPEAFDIVVVPLS